MQSYLSELAGPEELDRPEELAVSVTELYELLNTQKLPSVVYDSLKAEIDALSEAMSPTFKHMSQAQMIKEGSALASLVFPAASLRMLLGSPGYREDNLPEYEQAILELKRRIENWSEHFSEV